MRELNWGAQNSDDFVNPWGTANAWVKDGKDIMNTDWQSDSDYEGHKVVSNYNKMATEFDNWLSGLGYEREGEYYRVKRKNRDTVMMVSHGGSSSVALSHIFNMPFTFVCRAICPDFTAITVVSLGGDEGELTSPQFELVNDARHIAGIETENYFGR